jgi:preprotein translocase subunit SecF
MLRLFDNAHYDVLRLWRTAFAVAVIFAIPGILLLGVRGLNLSIEFTGGTFLQIRMADEDVGTGDLRAALNEGGVTGAEIQTYGLTGNEFAIRARLEASGEVSETAAQATVAAVREALNAAFATDGYEILRTDAVGPKVGHELSRRAVLALVLAFGAIFVFIWFRYEWRFGLAAVLATVHDLITTAAFISYLDLEMSLILVAALLLIIGYSLNDTIVTFDRVRENLRKFKRANLVEILNRSINETLPRTVLTSGTTLGATLALVFLGGEVSRGFAMVVTFGIVTGTFSSIFIASPLLLYIEGRWPGEDARGAKALTTKTVPATS